MKGSSFVRKGAANVQDPGTRPGLHSQTLVSSGVAGLDRLLGGGIPLGSVCLLLEDGSARQCSSLARCFLGEGAACGQNLCWAAHSTSGGAAAFIPAQQRGGASTRGGGNGAEEEEDRGEPLRIAWQYRRYIKKKADAEAAGAAEAAEAASKQRRGSSASASRRASKADWCHSFDLGNGIGHEGLRASKCTVAVVDGQAEGAPAGERLRAGVRDLLARVAEGSVGEGGTRGPLSVGRLAALSLSHPAWRLAPADLLHLLFWLRTALRDTRCAALVSLDARAFPPGFQQRAVHLADTVAHVRALRSDALMVALAPDSSTATGVLSLLRLPSCGGLGVVPLGPEGTAWLLRHKRRRLVLEEIDIDPDAEQALAEAGSATGASAVSLLCAAPAAKSGAGKLDF
mmetsp:Transcript_43401/g.109896  ORF Transcript_43401/g.109896 Transcript_43401/m.109896 type:complete len:400 (+) Transcript_43401:275-1474(+)